MTPIPLLDALRRDQITRWRTGNFIPAESYLVQHSDLSDEDALVMIIGEATLRRERGEIVSLQDFCRRFPRLADALRLQFQLENELSESMNFEP